MELTEVKDFLESKKDDKEVSKYLNSIFDSRVTSAVTNFEKRFNEEKLPKILEEKLKEKKEVDRETQYNIKERALEFCAEHPNIPYKLAIKTLTDPDQIDNDLSELDEAFNAAYYKGKSDLMAKSAYKPMSASGSQGQLGEADLKRMSPSQVAEAVRKGFFDKVLGRN